MLSSLSPPLDADAWARVEEVSARFAEGHPEAFNLAAAAVHEHPTNPRLLQLAALTALHEDRPEHALRYLKRLEKRYIPDGTDVVIKALALAHQERWEQARRLLLAAGVQWPKLAASLLNCPNQPFLRRARATLRVVLDPERHPNPTPRPARKGKERGARTSRAGPARGTATRRRPAPGSSEDGPARTEPGIDPHPLASDPPRLSLQFRLTGAPSARGEPPAEADMGDYLLRRGLTELGLARGFDELLCLSTLRSVDTYAHQVETVRKVLKQFRGRVLLADEVGLGKTVEAGMIVKEYLLRGMARRVLVLTPASLVGQWKEELLGKFDLDFTTTQDPAFKREPEKFWRQPLVLASIAAARRAPHAQILSGETFDVVVVDEAHHLKNRRTRGYELVNSLRKRFLLLLSATPVQNDLLELYNVLTLLKPGIFKTQKDFRSAHMTRGKPRVPADQNGLKDLMRDVMIRNTRALVDVGLPPRHALTLRPDPAPDEAACYRDLTRWVRARAAGVDGGRRLGLRGLLTAAGSSPQAAAAALARSLERHGADGAREAEDLARRYAAVGRGAKEQAFLELMARDPGARTMVFAQHRATLYRLGDLLEGRGLAFARFDGSLSGPEKDAAIARFRDEVPILLSSESGGEGRNVQFADTLVNFDLPWNPMTLEQRIGRLHRIGQRREVSIFNLATRHTIEDRLLRILDEKINMFELVVGEIGDILGEIDDERDFGDLVFTAWLAGSDGAPGEGVDETEDGLSALADAMLRARERHAEAKALDEALFGDEFEAL